MKSRKRLILQIDIPDAWYRYNKVKPSSVPYPVQKQNKTNASECCTNDHNSVVTLTHGAHHTLPPSSTCGCSEYLASSRRSMDKRCPNTSFFYDPPSRLGSGVQGPEKRSRKSKSRVLMVRCGARTLSVHA